MDPNLLPKDLRGREMIEKSKVKKVSKVFDFSLNDPQKEISKSNYSKIKKQGFFSKLLGFNKKIDNKDSLNLTSPESFKKANITDNDLLNKSKKSNGFFKNILGEPVSPLLTSSKKPLEPQNKPISSDFNHKKNEHFKKEVKESVVKVEVKDPIKNNFSKKVKKDSWFSVLRGFVSLSKKKKMDFKLASDSDNSDNREKEFDRLLNKESEIKNEHLKKEVKEDVVKVEVKDPVVLISEEVEKNPLKKDVEKKIDVINNKDNKEVKKSKKFYKRSKLSDLAINLVPKNIISSRENSLSFEFWFFIIIFLLSILSILISYFVLFYFSQRIKAEIISYQLEFNDLQNKIGDFVSKEKINNELADKVELIKKTNNNQIIWSNFFELLEKYTLDGVYFTSLSADTSGVLILPGVADNYNTLSRQLALFNKADDFIKEAKLSNAQLYTEGKAGVVGVSFQIRLILQDKIFKKL